MSALGLAACCFRSCVLGLLAHCREVVACKVVVCSTLLAGQSLLGWPQSLRCCDRLPRLCCGWVSHFAQHAEMLCLLAGCWLCGCICMCLKAPRLHGSSQMEPEVPLCVDVWLTQSVGGLVGQGLLVPQAVLALALLPVSSVIGFVTHLHLVEGGLHCARHR